MDDEIDSVVLAIRADTRAFARDVADMRRELDGPLADGVAGAASTIETALGRALRQGRFGFDELKAVAVRALSDIAAQALTVGLGGGGQASALPGLSALATSLLGLPGRAAGGDVAPGRPYVVGERGPELFVPTSAGRVEAGGRARGPVAITVNLAAPRAGEGAGEGYMARTGQQVARAVRQALTRVDG